MLVLSRRPSETILFPSLGITVQLLSIRGNAVKIGVDAPAEVAVLRGELQGTPSSASVPRPVEPSATERLNRAQVLLQQYQGEREHGLESEAEETLAQLNQVLQWQGPAPADAPRAPRLFRNSAIVPDVLVERAGLRTPRV